MLRLAVCHSSHTLLLRKKIVSFLLFFVFLVGYGSIMVPPSRISAADCRYVLNFLDISAVFCRLLFFFLFCTIVVCT